MPSSAGQTCALDRKSTRLNSSHTIISYAVFCLKKKPTGPRGREHARGGARPRAQGRLARRATRRRRRGAGEGDGGRRRGRLAAPLFFFKEGAPPEISPFPPPRPLPR